MEKTNSQQNYKAKILNINNPDDLIAYNNILQISGLQIFDTIHHQLKEFVKCKHVKPKLLPNEIVDKANEIENKTAVFYGNWVYYDWSNKLVRLLPEKEFVELRTNRNCYKITPDERDILAKKVIGIIGLSVGQSIALTLAMERGFGELRLADFDTLDLSNLNRIRAGVHNLGLNKAIITAREIAEIDPYLNVVCYTDGLHTENINQFFAEPSKLDLLIDECDGLDIKILARHKAKSLKIPVFMDTSDRGMVDIERFDLEPDRPILHGLVGDLEPSKIVGLTNEQKIPYILPMLGYEQISSRLKASMMEIDETISTWPQLASSVVLGGALGADISRKILLNQSTVSGRYYVDLDEIIVEPTKLQKDTFANPYQELSKQKCIEIVSAFLNQNTKIGSNKIANNLIEDFIEKACLAPSGGNCQPWKWVYHNHILFLLHDKFQSHSLLDYNHLGSLLALGAAAENLIIYANNLGYEVGFNQVNKTTEDYLIAYFTFTENASQNKPFSNLANVITIRETNRSLEEITPVNNILLTELNDLVIKEKGFELLFINESNKIKDLGNVLAGIERIRLLHPRGHDDFVNEIRWTEEENVQKRNGVDLETVPLTVSEKAGLRIAKDKDAIKLINQLYQGKSFEKMMLNTINTAPVIGLLVGEKNCDYLTAGRVLERCWLKANQQKLAFHPISPSTFFFKRIQNNAFDGFSGKMVEEIKECNNKFHQIFELQNNKEPIFAFKLFNSQKTVKKSLRKNINEVFYNLK